MIATRRPSILSSARVAWGIAIVLLAYDVSLLRSRNLFDYVVDPAMVAIAFVVVAIQ